MGWTRLDSAWHREKRHRRAGFFARCVLQAAVQASEERDWQRDERRGFVPRDAFDAEEVALQLALTADTALLALIPYPTLLASLEQGLAACEREGLLVCVGDAGWFIDGWSAYRKDPTATERKRRQRGKKPQAGHGDKRDGGAKTPGGEGAQVVPEVEPDVTVGHDSHRDKPAQAQPDTAAPTADPSGHGDPRDVTLRNGTLRPPPEEESFGLTPPPEVGEDDSPPVENRADPTLPGVRVWPAPTSTATRLGRLKALEFDLRGISVDSSDYRQREARLKLHVANRDAGWVSEVERLLAAPRVLRAVANG